MAYWADGTPLAIRGKRRVDLNMLPGDEGAISGSWGGSGGELITNAILYLSAPMLQSPRKPDLPQRRPRWRKRMDDDHVPQHIRRADRHHRHRHRRQRQSPVHLSQRLCTDDRIAHHAGNRCIDKRRRRIKPQVQGVHRATLYLAMNGLPRIETALEGTSKGNLWVSQSPIDFGGNADGNEQQCGDDSAENAGTMPIDLQNRRLATASTTC